MYSLDELSHSSDCVLNWSSLVRSMKVIQIDSIDAQSLKRFTELLPDIVRTAVDGSAGITRNSELGRQKDIVALSGTFEPTRSLE